MRFKNNCGPLLLQTDNGTLSVKEGAEFEFNGELNLGCVEKLTNKKVSDSVVQPQASVSVTPSFGGEKTQGTPLGNIVKNRFKK